MAIHGSKIYVAEATLTPTTVVWRVATGPGWASAGGQPSRDAGVLGLDGWEDPAEAITCEVHHSVSRVSRSLSRMANQLAGVRPLPLG